MIITKDKDNLIVKIPFHQKVYDTFGEKSGETDNLIGVIAGDEITISRSIDMSYKGKDSQEGMPLIHFDGTEPEFIRLCEELGISYIKHSLCDYCNKVLYGSFTIGDKGNMCFECEHRKPV